MTISGFGNGVYWEDGSHTKRDSIFAGGLNPNLFAPSKRRNPEAEALKEEWEDRRRRLENLSSTEGASEEKKLERVQALREGMDELRSMYNQKRPFKIPEEMKEDAERFAKAIRRMFPQTVVKETTDEQKELSEAVGEKEVRGARTDPESQVEEEKVIEDQKPFITEEVFDKPERTDLRNGREYAVDTKKRAVSYEEAEEKDSPIREEAVDAGERIGLKEETGIRKKDEDKHAKEKEEEGVLASLRKLAEEINERKPRITEYLFGAFTS